jgi:hypothetical protein
MSDKSRKFCIAVVVNKKYENYIPYFCFFTLKSYPDYFIKIFSVDSISEEIKDVLFKTCNIEKISIIENFFKNLPKSNQELKTFRWLIPNEYFKDYDYVYIGDVDMLICKEAPGILEQHINHCNINCLPYSNCIRPNTNRLSGLHFFKVNEYCKFVDETIKKYKDLLKKRKLGLNNRKKRNEQILYNIIVESGLDLPKDKHRIDINGSGPHHGVHLGLWRSSGDITSQQLDYILNDNYEEYFLFIKKIYNDDNFKFILNNIHLVEFTRMFNYLNKR